MKKFEQLTTEDWLSMPLKTRFWNYAKWVTKGRYMVEDCDKDALNEIIRIVETRESGIILVSLPGRGKDFIFRILTHITFEQYHPQRLQHKNCIDVVADFSNNGYDALARYGKGNWLFRDLGYEEAGNHYNDKNVETMQNIIHKREISRSAEQGWITHFSSNIGMSDLGKKYNDGGRTISRLLGMCQTVVLSGTDKRLLGLHSLYMPEILVDNTPVFDPATWVYKPSEPRDAFAGLREQLAQLDKIKQAIGEKQNQPDNAVE